MGKSHASQYANFGSLLPSLNDNLENALEATYSTKAWPGLE